MNILITGATGTVGKHLISHLEQRGTGQRVFYAVRKPALARDQLPGRTWQIRQFDFEDELSYRPALQQINKIFLLRPPKLTDVKRQIVPLLEEAKRSQIEHIVFLSIQGVNANTWTPHFKIEQAIKEAGLPYTFLRPGFFFQNLHQEMGADIRQRDEIFVPAQARVFNFVDAAEVAEVAALALTTEGHLNQSYTLTGTSPIDYYRVAAALSDALDRGVRYANPSIPYFLFRKLAQGKPLPFALVQTVLYRYTRIPEQERFKHTLQRLLQRPPTGLQAYLEQNRELFEPKPPLGQNKGTD